MTRSLSLLDTPATWCVSCVIKYGRAGQYCKENLIVCFSADIALPDLRHEIAQCERRGKMDDACAVHYVGLTG